MDRVIDSELVRIGQRVRRWRADAGLTLQALARRSGVAASTIQKVETAQMTPSVVVLLKIARGLGRRPTELIHDGEPDRRVLHLPASGRRRVGLEQRMLVERLSGDLTEPALEMWRVTLWPGRSSGREPLAYQGEEILVCERGRLSVQVAGEAYELAPGDTLHLKASLPHSWHNGGARPARFTVTGTLPEKLRDAMQRRVRAAGA